MNILSDSLPLRIVNIEKTDLNCSWNYKDICSPFFRMFYILDGEGQINHKGKIYSLKPDNIYLIPSYTQCSYSCRDQLSMIYILFVHQMYNEMRVYYLHDHLFEVNSLPGDKSHFERLIELNPNMELLYYDPARYDNLDYLDRCKKLEKKKSINVLVESQGILLQLFSRFSYPENEGLRGDEHSIEKIFPVLQYINQNIGNKMSVDMLADKLCLSNDYFSRLFQKVTKIRPIEYIQRKRIEKAQLLLITTDYSLEKIASKTGLNNASYLTRLFKRYTGKSPGKYRLSGSQTSIS
jgi:AraC family transcriptional regulator